MRVCRYLDDPTGAAPLTDARIGRVTEHGIEPLAVRSVREIMSGAAARADGPPVGPGRVRLLAPLVPGKLIGVGLNYREHAAETGKPLPTEPLLFAKFPSAVTGPGGPVRKPVYTDELDYEGELAVVIGSTAREVSVDRALDHVFGYAVMNDISARDRQRDEPQWVRAKSGDTFAPFGPWITTRDEVPDPQALTIRTWVNDELRQDGATSDMVFGVAELIAYCSRSFTLEPGDVITTGTPAGVAAGMASPTYLVPGDHVRVEIVGLGSLEHNVVD
ncbi:MAG: fumarylacetoacetate hydrolase family protein [Actinobacteria bacterium]|nr:fumarylacetoacetate hydrolase family protein [Actinomycetota bacterium]